MSAPPEEISYCINCHGSHRYARQSEQGQKQDRFLGAFYTASHGLLTVLFYDRDTLSFSARQGGPGQ